MGLPALRGVLQDQLAAMLVGKGPLLDLFQGSKASQAGQVVAQAAIPDARRLSGVVHITHKYRSRKRTSEFDHMEVGRSG
jgi:hypothetical protein